MCGFVQQGFVPGDGTPKLLLHMVCVVSDVTAPGWEKQSLVVVVLNQLPGCCEQE